MGKDIHWFVERYDEDENFWEFIDGTIPVHGDYRSNLIYNYRNYAIFAKLSGVVTPGIKPKYKLRGLPDDCNPITEACSIIQGEYATNHSWLTVDEMESLTIDDEIFQSVLNEIKKKSHGLPMRVVFWFDI